MIYIVAQFCLECTIFRSCGRGNEIKLGRDLVAGGIIDLLRSSATPSLSCTLADPKDNCQCPWHLDVVAPAFE